MSDQLKTVVLGDKAVQVAVSDLAAFEQFKSESAKAIADAESKLKSAVAAKDEEIGALKVDLAAAKAAAVVDVDALVAARTELVSIAKMVDSKIEPKGMSDADLRKAVVVAKLGAEVVADASEAEVAGMFKAVSKTVKGADPVADAFRGGVKTFGDAASQMKDAFVKANHDLNAWRNQGGAN